MKELIISLMKYLAHTKMKCNNIPNKTTNNQEFIININCKENLPEEFIYKLQKDIIPLHEEISDIMDIDDCKKFAIKIQKLGLEFNISCFEKLSIKLDLAIKTFQLSEIKELLKAFNKSIQKLNIN